MKHLSLILLAQVVVSTASFSQDGRFMPVLPGEVIQKTGYSISWNDDLKMPFMISYELTSQELDGLECAGANYRNDPDVNSFVEADYKGTASLGYEKGHLLPKMHGSWSQGACKHSSYYSNITLQSKEINRGLWRKCDNRIDEIVRLTGKAYVHTGPLPFYTDTLPSGIRVPIGFWKVVIYEDDSEWRKEVYLVAQNENEEETPFQIDCANESALELFLGHDVFNHSLVDPIASVQKVPEIAKMDSLANLPKWSFLDGEFYVKEVLEKSDLRFPDEYYNGPSSFVKALRYASMWSSNMVSLKARSSGLLCTGAIMGRLAFSGSQAFENYGMGGKAVLAFREAAESFAILSESVEGSQDQNEFNESSASCYEQAAKFSLLLEDCEEASAMANQALLLNPNLDNCRRILERCK